MSIFVDLNRNSKLHYQSVNVRADQIYGHIGICGAISCTKCIVYIHIAPVGE